MWEAPESSSGLQWGCCWGWAGEHCALKHAQPSPSPLIAPPEPARDAVALAATSSESQRRLPSKACVVPQEPDLIPGCGAERERVQRPPALRYSSVCLAECEWLYGWVTVRLEVAVGAC